MRVTVRVPATSANLGPGFDCFGLALDLCNEVTVETGAGSGVRWDGEGADELPVDGTDIVSRAMRSVAQKAGSTLPPVQLRGVNRIPLERGLGSSSAAAVAGVAIGRLLLGIPAALDPPSVFDHAAGLEGHPDNAAPAAFGGLTVIADGRVRRFEVSDALTPVVLVPRARLPTGEARRALPERVPLGDAVFNVAHGALVVQALVEGDRELLHLALRDRLHQAVRLSLVPQVGEVFERLGAKMPICVSGAGPSLLAFPRDPAEVVHQVDGWRVLPVSIRATGPEIVER